MLDWTHLQTIGLIARWGSLAAVARELDLHPTTVARRLASAEEAMGEQIFLRTGPRHEPTAAGRRLIEALSPLVTPMERVARVFEKEEEHRVRIATTENGARVLAAYVIPRLLETHPQVEVEIFSSNLTRDLREGVVDFAMRVVEPTEPFYVRRNLGSVRYGLYGAESYLNGRRSIESLETERVLFPGGELANSPEASYLSTQAVDAHVVFRCSSLIALASAAEEGLGLVVLPTNLAAFHPRLHLLRRLDEEIEPRPVMIVYHSDRTVSPKLRAVLEVVVSEISAFLKAC